MIVRWRTNSFAYCCGFDTRAFLFLQTPDRDASTGREHAANMASEYQRVREYELMVILHPDLSEEDLGSAVTTIEGMITGQSGELRLTNREMPWGRRRLAYPIRHGGRDVRDGFYVLIYFTAVSTALAEIERDIKLDDRIMRYLLTQQSAPIMEPVVEEEGEGAEGEAESTEETEAPRRTPTRRTAPSDSDAQESAPAATELAAAEAEPAPAEEAAAAVTEEAAPPDAETPAAAEETAPESAEASPETAEQEAPAEAATEPATTAPESDSSEATT